MTSFCLWSLPTPCVCQGPLWWTPPLSSLSSVPIWSYLIGSGGWLSPLCTEAAWNMRISMLTWQRLRHSEVNCHPVSKRGQIVKFDVCSLDPVHPFREFSSFSGVRSDRQALHTFVFFFLFPSPHYFRPMVQSYSSVTSSGCHLITAHHKHPVNHIINSL